MRDVHHVVEEDEVNDLALLVEVDEAHDVLAVPVLALPTVHELCGRGDELEQFLRGLFTGECRRKSAKEDQEQGEKELLHGVSPGGIPR